MTPGARLGLGALWLIVPARFGLELVHLVVELAGDVARAVGL